MKEESTSQAAFSGRGVFKLRIEASKFESSSNRGRGGAAGEVGDEMMRFDARARRQNECSVSRRRSARRLCFQPHTTESPPGSCSLPDPDSMQRTQYPNTSLEAHCFCKLVWGKRTGYMPQGVTDGAYMRICSISRSTDNKNHWG